ncbi:MAG: LuxR C-terminal-related transcriptional regulator [Oscillospiraceae bacterium]|nr:LuxR C-terminal-related transcriptional regulator [Oscillospiraceae bacterium]
MKNTNGNEPHYFSDRLRQKLNKLRSFPATIVEAPSGYGKTTAVRDFLESVLPPGTPVFWFTAADEAPASGFRRLYREIDKIDGSVGQRLMKIGYPNSATVGEASDALRSIGCRCETYLVIDNFQYIQQDVPRSLFSALIEHSGANLHIIMITQVLTRDMITVMESRVAYHITASDLRLDEGDIRHFYALSGADISAEEAGRIERYTEGWIIAVYLQLRFYRDRGAFSSDAPGILSLMEHLVWDKLNEAQQMFLVRLSAFETVTIREACILNAFEALPEYAAEAMSNPFIRYDPSGQRYELHSILSELLIQKRRERGTAFERECLLRAGNLCRDAGKIPEALGFYWQIRDYERILALDFSDLIVENIGAVPFLEIALRIARDCPAEIRGNYILSMLRISWALLLNGEKAEYRKLLEELRPMLDADSEVGKKRQLGEWLLLSSFDMYPDLGKMTAVLKEAEPLFEGSCSQIILPSSPLCFGNYMMFTEFHLRPGEAELEAKALERYIAVYSRLTNGNGAGADALFRSALAYYRMDLGEAEILAYKAAYLAESSRQSIILLGAAHVLAEIAVQKGDVSGWQSAVSAMERAAASDAGINAAFRSSVDIVRGVLFCELQATNRIAGWLRAGEFSENHVLPSMLDTARFVHFTSLHFQGKYESMIGKTQAVFSASGSSSTLFDIIMYFLMAIGYMRISRNDEAQKCLEQAADMAVPDGLLLPFVAYSWLLEGLPDKLIEEKYPSLKDHFHVLKEQFQSGWYVLYQDICRGISPADLTEREAEVAKLAAEGMRKGEIAEKLCVSESTVRAHLRTIFQKLDIDRRAKLAEKLK